MSNKKKSLVVCPNCKKVCGYDLNQNIRIKLENLHTFYNSCVNDYKENGEEDFNCFLDMFKESENK